MIGISIRSVSDALLQVETIEVRKLNV